MADTQYDDADIAIRAVPHPNNPNGFRAYTQSYTYDEVGNITEFDHDVIGSSTGDWTRDYTYVSGTNRLDETSHSGGDKSYSYDAHGNITAMAHLNSLDWDHLDQLRHVEVTTGQDVTVPFYVRPDPNEDDFIQVIGLSFASRHT